MRFVTLLVFSALLPLAAAEASLIANPSYIHLRATAGTGWVRQNAYVRNLGPTEVNVNAFHNCGSDFRIFDNCFGLLRPNFSCSLSIDFRPRARGMDTCTIRVQGIGGGTAYIRVQGTGT